MSQTKHGLPSVYTYVALVFITGSVGLTGWVGYSLAGSAQVVLTLRENIRETKIVVQVSANQAGGEANVQGRIIQQTAAGQRSGSATGSRIGVADTVGSVKIINDHTQAQTLVATTRLLAADGTLLRLKSRVVVPARSSASAAVHPDQPDAFLELAPTHFTIPGLWQPLQAKIYAVSDAPLKAGGTAIPVVTARDVETTERELWEELTKQATAAIGAQLSQEQALYTQLLDQQVVERVLEGSIGAEQSTFFLRLKLEVVSIAFDETQMLALVRRNLTSTMPPGQTIIDLNIDDLAYAVQRFDPGAQTASIAVTAKGQVGLRPESQWLNAASLAGMTKADIERFYSGLDALRSVVVYFRPAWLWQAPKTTSRIQITVQ